MCLLVPQLTSFACCARVPAFARHSRRRKSVGEMDHLLGMVGDGYALVAADRKVSNSIIAVKHDEDKILALDESKLLGCVGELGDTKNFTEFIQKNIAVLLYEKVRLLAVFRLILILVVLIVIDVCKLVMQYQSIWEKHWQNPLRCY